MAVAAIDKLSWFGGSSFRWEGSKVIYFDPWKLKGKAGSKADLIFISHEHFDHFSRKDIVSIASAGTVIVCSSAVYGQLKDSGIPVKEARSLAPGEDFDFAGIDVKAVPSYNIGKPYHPRNDNKLGFIVSMDGVSVYHAGDTDRIPEMKNIKCDIALLPVGGTYTMNAGEAALAACDILPKIAVPMHYGDSAGSVKDAGTFKKALEGKIEVRILAKEK